MYIYVPSGSVGSPDRTAFSTLLADRLTPYDPVLRPWGIASGSGDYPAQTPLTGGFMEAMADSILLGVGYQARNVAAGTANSSVGPNTFIDVPGFSSATITVPCSKNYLVHVDLNIFCSALGGGDDVVLFQLVVGSNTSQDASMLLHFETANVRKGLSFRTPIFFSAGPNTVKLQWECTSGATTINTDVRSFRAFNVTG